jgi:flagellar motor switch protein FliM
MTMFRMPPLTGTILFETNPQFSFQIIDVLLGGTGERNTVSKEFSDIDKNIMMQITSGMISNLKLAWEDILSVEPEVESLETNPAINQTLAPNEPVALVTFSVEMGKSNTFINICIPYLSIEKVLDKLVVQYWFQNEKDASGDEVREKIKEGLNPVEIEMSAELGCTHLTIDDFLNLSRGDIIRLDNKCTSPIKIYVEDQECYYAKPGITGKNLGVAVLDIIDKDVNEYE